MSGFLRQSTASQSRLIGPFVDDTDFKTAETGLTIANTDVKLRANGTTLSNKNSGGGTHQVNGMYSLTWDATDTANVGELYYSVAVSGALQVFGVYTVLEEVVYDALFASSALGYVDGATVNATKIGGTTQTGRDIGASVLLSSGTGTGQVSLSSGTVTVGTNNDKTGYRLSATGVDDVWDEPLAGHTTAGTTGKQLADIATGTAPTAAAIADAVWDEVITGNAHNVNNSAAKFLRNAGGGTQVTIHSGTAQAGSTSTTIKLDTGASAVNDIYNRNLVVITGGTGVGQTRRIVDYVGATRVATVDQAWVTTPTNTSTFDIIAAPISVISDEGLAQGGAADSITLASTASTVDDIYVNALVTITAGTGAGQTRQITDYVGSTRVATVDTNWSVTPDNTSVYAVIPAGDAVSPDDGGGNAPTAGAIADAVWDEVITADMHNLPNSAAVFLADIEAEIAAALVAYGALRPTVAGRTLDVNASGEADAQVVGATPAAMDAFADALLNRDWTLVNDSNARTLLNALRFLRNKWSTPSGTLTVTKEDDTTTAWTGTTTGTPGAPPITGVDPA